MAVIVRGRFRQTSSFCQSRGFHVATARFTTLPSEKFSPRDPCGTSYEPSFHTLLDLIFLDGSFSSPCNSFIQEMSQNSCASPRFLCVFKRPHTMGLSVIVMCPPVSIRLVTDSCTLGQFLTAQRYSKANFAM